MLERSEPPVILNTWAREIETKRTAEHTRDTGSIARRDALSVRRIKERTRGRLRSMAGYRDAIGVRIGHGTDALGPRVAFSTIDTQFMRGALRERYSVCICVSGQSDAQ